MIKTLKRRFFLRTLSYGIPAIHSINVLNAGTGKGASSQNNYYVSPTGLDSNPGTKSRPFKTINKALDIIKRNGKGNCIIMPGIYSEKINLKNFNAKSGSPAKITSSTGKAEDVVITSLEKVTKKWVQVEKNIWRAKVTPGKPLLHTKKQREYLGKDISHMMYSALVFKDNKPLNLARYPGKPVDSNDLMDHAAGKIDYAKSTLGGGKWNSKKPTYIGSKIKGAYHIYTKFKDSLPEKYTTESLQGAYLWANCGRRWTSWVLPVEEVIKNEGTDPQTGTKMFAGAIKVRSKSSWVSLNMPPGYPSIPKDHGNTGYLVGARILLDSEGEFHYTIDHKNPDNSYIEIYSEKDPNKDGSIYYYKSRKSGVILNNCKNIQVSNVTLRCGGVNIRNSSQCIINGMKIELPTYGYSISDNKMDSKLPGDKAGLSIDDLCSEIIVKNCKITDCAGRGVDLDGKDNYLHNNIIQNVNYMGMNESGIDINGERNTLSYNTVKRCGRSAIDIHCGQSRIIYNDFSDAGYLTQDMGALHSNGDVDNTEIAYNWFHDISEGNGIYMDNFNTGFIVHHNVVWDVNGSAIRTNVPSNFTMIINNTLLECRDPEKKGYKDIFRGKNNKNGRIDNVYCPWDGPSDSYSSIWANNLAIDIKASDGNSTGLTMLSNHTYGNETRILDNKISKNFDPDVHTPKFIEKKTGGILNKGKKLPGITDEKGERQVDIGAYQSTGRNWRAGCDFINPPALPSYQPSKFKFRNLIFNSSFNHSKGGYTRGKIPNQALTESPETPKGWKLYGSGILEARYFSGFVGTNSGPSPADRNSIHDNSLLISSNSNKKLIALFSGLDSQYNATKYIKVEAGKPYTFSAFLRIKPDTVPSEKGDYHDLDQQSIDRPAEKDNVSDKNAIKPIAIELIATDEKGEIIESIDLDDVKEVGNWMH